jgi:formylmethanofuran dehydrogenase subunit E
MSMNRQLDEYTVTAVAEHGHLGPFSVLGVKPAFCAEECLGSDVDECFLEAPNQWTDSCVMNGTESAVGPSRGEFLEYQDILATSRGGTKEALRVQVRDDAVLELRQKYLNRLEPQANELKLKSITEMFGLANN